MSPPDATRLRRQLVRWFRRNRRELPWRRSRNPYAVWVAEIMLQQTQAATVAPYYERFLARFPDARSLAAAKEEEVLGLWAGLGYYRRARMLHQAARHVAERWNGRLPSSADELRRLPGVGRYTAAAVASIAYGERVGVVDGNVRRVLSRLMGWSRPGSTELWELADRLASGQNPGEVNEALMELGALVCRPSSPSCRACPWRRSCSAAAEGRAEAYPSPSPQPQVRRGHLHVLVVVRSDRVLLVPRSQGPLRGSWDVPVLPERPGGGEARALHAGSFPHAIMQHRYTVDVWTARSGRRWTGDRAAPRRWVPVGSLDTEPVSAVTLKAVRLACAALRARARRPATDLQGSSHGGQARPASRSSVSKPRRKAGPRKPEASPPAQ